MLVECLESLTIFIIFYMFCADTDECTSSPNMCIQNAQCSNTVGSYVCQCAVGYSGDGYSNCTGEYTDIVSIHSI